MLQIHVPQVQHVSFAVPQVIYEAYREVAEESGSHVEYARNEQLERDSGDS